MWGSRRGPEAAALPQVVWDLAGDSGARAREARAGQRPVAETPEAIWRATAMLASERQASQTPPPTLLTVEALLAALELADRTRTGKATPFRRRNQQLSSAQLSSAQLSSAQLLLGTSIGDIGPFCPKTCSILELHFRMSLSNVV